MADPKKGKHSKENIKSNAKLEPASEASGEKIAGKETAKTDSNVKGGSSRFGSNTGRSNDDPHERPTDLAIFRLLRNKIVAAIMLVLAMLFFGLLTVIYTSSYYEVYQRDVQLLESYSQAELNDLIWKARLGSNTHSPSMPSSESDLVSGSPRHYSPTGNIMRNYNDKTNTPTYKLSTFYSVVLSYDEQPLSIINTQGSIYTDDQLYEMALWMVQNGQNDGTYGSLVYMVTYFSSNTTSGALVAMMDNTLFQESSSTLFRYTLVFGIACILVFFILARYLARWIVQPLEENYLHQLRFISDAGHELKTPIAVINANSDLLKREIGENQWLSNIKYENERMSTLVAKMLQLAHAEQDKPKLTQVDLSRLIAGEVLPFESLAFEKNLTLRTNIAEDININGDPLQLKQLISIMLDNALSYATPDSVIDITLFTERNNAIIEVGNDAENVSEDSGEHFFKRFYRADDSREDTGNHYGLGLSIAKAIVKNNKGTIEAKVNMDHVVIRCSLPM